MNLVCFDIGGTRIKYGVVSADGELLHSDHVPTPAKEGAVSVCEVLTRIASDLLPAYSSAGIAVSSLGVVDVATGTVMGSCEAIPDFAGFRLGDHLRNRFAVPVSVENDVNAVALAEAWVGAASGRKNFVAVTLGTNIGGGLFIDGKVYRGGAFAAGEWGNFVVGDSTWEQTASLGALGRRAAWLTDGAVSDAKAVFEQRCDPRLRKLLHEWTTDVGLGLANICYALNPELIVIGGAIVNQGHSFLLELQTKVLSILTPPFDRGVELKFTTAGDYAGVIGAACYWQMAHHGYQLSQGKSHD